MLFRSLAYGLAILIAFSRIFLLVHFPSDVLAGALLGASLGVLVPWACKKWLLPLQSPLEAP